MKAPLMTCWKCRDSAPLRVFGAWLSFRVTGCMVAGRHDLGWWEFLHQRAGHQRHYFTCAHCFSTAGVYCRDVVPYVVREVERLHQALEREDRGEITVPYLTPAEISSYLAALDAKHAKPELTPAEEMLLTIHKPAITAAEIAEPQPPTISVTATLGPNVDGIRCELCGRPFCRGSGTWQQIDAKQSKRRYFVCPHHPGTIGAHEPKTAAELLIAQLREPIELTLHVTGGPPR